jgi:hypothetical protein
MKRLDGKMAAYDWNQIEVCCGGGRGGVVVHHSDPHTSAVLPPPPHNHSIIAGCGAAAETWQARILHRFERRKKKHSPWIISCWLKEKAINFFLYKFKRNLDSSGTITC